jgi:uncharacterized protein YggE
MKTTILALLLLTASPGFCKEDFQKLTVSGSSVIYKPSDMFSMTIGVVTHNKDVKLAMNSNAKKMTPIFKTLADLGLTDKEYQTGSYSINPQYTPQPKSPPPDWHSEISGYEVRNTIVIRTKKLDLVSAIIDAVSKDGANLIENVNFSLDNEDAAKSQAIAQAVAQARLYADSAAKAAGVKLGPIQQLTINPSMGSNPRTMKMYSSGVQETSTPISPGEVEVSSNVSIVYEIQP